MSETRASDSNGERPSVIKLREMATILHVHQSTMYRLLRQRRIPFLRIGTDYRFEPDKVIAALEASASKL